jgi:DNA-binding IclR family transcriptional regulator
VGNTHLRGSGKALLAFIREDELRHYISTADFTPLTEHSVCNENELCAQLEKIREQGYALDLDEFADEVSCVSAPVFTAGDDVVAALTISAPTGRYIQNEKKYIDAVTQTARKTSVLLGYRSSEARILAEVD